MNAAVPTSVQSTLDATTESVDTTANASLVMKVMDTSADQDASKQQSTAVIAATRLQLRPTVAVPTAQKMLIAQKAFAFAIRASWAMDATAE